MKLLKFRDYLVPLVISGEKNSTWRLFDDKSLVTGDEIELRQFGKEESFAKGIVTKVVEKPFRELTADDKKGHEVFKSDDAMYRTYTEYYKTSVGPNTLVKIIWFDLY